MLSLSAHAARPWLLPSATLIDGTAIHVCGSMQGMATGVEAALVEIVGRERL